MSTCKQRLVSYKSSRRELQGFCSFGVQIGEQADKVSAKIMAYHQEGFQGCESTKHSYQRGVRTRMSHAES